MLCTPFEAETRDGGRGERCGGGVLLVGVAGCGHAPLLPLPCWGGGLGSRALNIEYEIMYEYGAEEERYRETSKRDDKNGMKKYDKDSEKRVIRMERRGMV
jgi:hypothetical protein